MLETLSTPGDTSWFTRDRFGLFIHWGLYALAARHEWVMSKENISVAEYERRYFKRFDPDLYDPNQWAKAAADAGMKYFVVTTKHHDGFALWDSKMTDYKATNTPYGKDLIRPMVEAFNAHGLRTGFYHSLLDWHHPDYMIDRQNHPRRNELSPLTDLTGNHSGARLKAEDINQGREQKRYAKYLRDQVRELLTGYGQVDALWFDFSYVNNPEYPRDDFSANKGREAWGSEKLYAMIRELMPNVILTDRLDLDLPLSGGDMKTPEQTQPQHWVTIEHEGKKVPVVWEACQTFSGSWGYYRDEHDWRSVNQLILTLIDCVSKGGNLLLNVGPTGRGEFDARALDRLAGIGHWMKYHGRSIYGCTQAPAEFEVPQDCRLTYNPEKNRLYVHLLSWPYKFINLIGSAYKNRVEYAQLLNDASELTGMNEWHAGHFNFEGDVTSFALPHQKPAGVEVPVIELFLKD
ncbi:MAG: alpha-L-fucosidase [Planctomycetota bacterium]